MTKRAVLLTICILALALAGCTSGTIESKEGNVRVTLPHRSDTVTFVKQADGSWKGSVRTTGSARVFEATVNWEASRTIASGVASLGQGSFMTSAGAPEYGTFDQTLTLVSAAADPSPAGTGTLRIFIASMKDGSQLDIVDIPLTLQTAP
jgi:hypothetical protein